MYGILLRIGGPNSLRPSDKRFRPPSSTVPPSGTFTVVDAVIVLKTGCCKNCVNGTGWPTAPPSKIGVMYVVIGNSCTLAGVKFVKAGVRDLRTNRRSAEITAFIANCIPPVMNGLLFGTNTTWPPSWATVTVVTKNCVSATVIVDVWPLNNVNFGACMTLVRWSPWAASMNIYTSISLKNAKPRLRPPLAPGLPGKAPNGGTDMA